MWTMAASLDEKYLDIEPLLYERSRKYIQDEEMKGYGEAFISVHHAQVSENCQSFLNFIFFVLHTFFDGPLS